jgi:hypothetical protein
LSYDNGLALKGEAIVNPMDLRSNKKIFVHKAHLGYDKMMRKARGVICWPGKKSKVKEIVDCCEVYQGRKIENHI